MELFTPQEREILRATLISTARADPDIVGVAITGSYSVNRQDRWSDIDLAFSLAPESSKEQVIAKWTERMYTTHGVVQHLDVYRGETL